MVWREIARGAFQFETKRNGWGIRNSMGERGNIFSLGDTAVGIKL